MRPLKGLHLNPDHTGVTAGDFIVSTPALIITGSRLQHASVGVIRKMPEALLDPGGSSPGPKDGTYVWSNLGFVTSNKTKMSV